jgi:hypothetical protein
MNRNVSIAIPVAQMVEPRVLQTMLTLVNYSANHGIKIHDVGMVVLDGFRHDLPKRYLS